MDETGFDLEFTTYALCARLDVNNYLSIKPDGKVKIEGHAVSFVLGD